MTTAALFSSDELSNSVHEHVDVDTAAVAERIVWGQIMGSTNLTERPDPVPDDLFSWALELGGIAFRNGLSQKSVGQVSRSWRDDIARRDEILRLIAGDDSGGSVGGPQGSFPAAQCWPDPILVGPRGPVSDATRQAALDWWNNQ